MNRNQPPLWLVYILVAYARRALPVSRNYHPEKAERMLKRFRPLLEEML